jgi:hypothetical protein
MDLPGQEEFLAEAAKQRGQYLDAMCTLEAKLDELLRDAFEVPDHLDFEFLYVLLDRMPLDRKITVLESLLKTRGISKEPTNALRKAQRHRNLLAHKEFFFWDDRIVRYARYEDGDLVPVEVSLEEGNQRQKEVEALSNQGLSRCAQAIAKGNDELRTRHEELLAFFRDDIEERGGSSS